MAYSKEFFNIPEGQIADVTFKFATGLTKAGQFGSYYLYTILHDGKEKFLKVTERFEKELRKLNINTKQVYSLYKETIHPKSGKPMTVMKIVVKNVAVLPVAQEPVQQSVASPEPETPSKQQPVVFTGDKHVMHQSMLDAVDITKAIPGVEWRNTDIEKIGVSLYLSRTGQLTIDQVLSNGNGNGKKSRKVKETPKPESVPTTQFVPAEAPVSGGNGKDDDLPF
jgi:hypothetical protein